jgi:hypothetical protein
LAVIALVAGVAVGIWTDRAINPLPPRCPEDSVLIGRGNFSDGRWDLLVCGPARDSYQARNPARP